MKESEFYQRAATDAAFRRAQLEEQHYFKQVGTGLMWFLVAFVVAATIFTDFTGREFLSAFCLTIVVAINLCHVLDSRPPRHFYLLAVTATSNPSTAPNSHGLGILISMARFLARVCR